MNNFSLLRFDKSCGIFGCFYRDCYDYPIAYEDGLVSRLKSVAAGRKVWGFVLKGYVISVYPVFDKTPAEAADYCRDKTFAGRPYCLVPLSEEKGLLKRFGKEYETYKNNVPRFIPRLSPYKKK